MSGLRKVLVSLALFVAPIAVGLVAPPDAAAAPAKAKDPLADAFGGQILFLDQSPPPVLGGPGWFHGHKITKKDENSDKRWPLHTMVFLKKPLDTPKLDLMVYKIDKKGTVDFVQKIEQFPNADVRTFYFLVTLRKEPPYEPNLKYQIKAVVPGGGAVAEGTIELTGKEEKIGGGDMDFTKGMDLSAPKEEKPTAPFDNAAAVEALKKVVYEDCKTAGSKGGAGKLIIRFAGKDGKVLDASFPKDDPPPYSDATQTCILRAFKTKAKTKPFAGQDKTISYKIFLD
jgi:hypothetical protein